MFTAVLRCGWPAALAAAVACAVVQPPASSAAVRGDDYVAVADRLALSLDGLWNEREQRYDPGNGAVSEVNADLLLVHSVAALRGLDGPSRADARARAIVVFLTGPQIWRATPPSDPAVRGPGWRSAPGGARHPVFDAEVAEGLACAYTARTVLGLAPASSDRIREQIALVARGPDYAWPALRLNQFNWATTLFAADAEVNGQTAALASGLGHHLERFLSQASRNLGPGLHFYYLPGLGLRAHSNLDSPEYADIVLGFSRHYGEAREAGMPAPPRLALLRDWVRRVLAGYWTHAGYLNWDTGLGFYRWHQRKKVPLAQAALLGIAAMPELQPGPEWGAWAKWLLDRGFETYVARVERDGRIPCALAYGVHTVPQAASNAYLAAARYAANAMRALQAGLDRAPSAATPALYSYDPDTGRLAITTPSYNTAIVPVNHGAFPYGGLDIARLFDADQEVAANIGGLGTAAFGLTVRSGSRTLIRTQYGARAYGASPLRLDGLRAARVHAGPFTVLRAHGSVLAHGLRATSAYRFTPGFIDARWSVSGRGGTASVTFPSWGRQASATALLCDGRTVRLGRAPVTGVRALRIRSARSGYTVTRLRDAVARLIPVAPQSSEPQPGQSVEIELGPAPASLAARITVAA